MANWERLAEQGQPYAPDDFRRAAYRLVMEQAIYATDRGSRVAYDLIVKHFSTYRELLGQLGMTVIHNTHMSYVVAIPSQYVGEKMRLNETRLALVLRRLYDDKINATELIAGEAHVTVHELERAYRDLMDRDLPDNTELRDLAQSMKRFGLARMIDATDEQPFVIVVRPGIVDILGETALLQLASHAPADGEEEDSSEAP